MPSTSLQSVEYDTETRTLLVRFATSGKLYAYLDVPLEAFEALARSFSKGTHFNTYIRDHYSYVLVEDA